MASVSASQLVIFIASVLIAASVAGTLTNTVGELDGVVEELGLDVTDTVRTDIEIISDSEADVYDIEGNENVTLYVKNTGTNQLPTDGSTMDVRLDNTYITDVSYSLIDSESWGPDDVARVEISAPDLENGYHTVELNLNGDEEQFSFTIEE